MWIGCALLVCLVTSAAFGRDAFVLISGGGTPLSNNYSQYLQARAISGFFEKNYPADSIWVFFGAGNREGEPVKIADARKQYKKDGLLLESWVPGVIKNNRPATRASILTAFQREILPAVADGGTLYLFIGDHGELSEKEPKESLITLWLLKEDPKRRGSWSTDEDEKLGVAELREVLRKGLGRGRVVFCMTQCHSGGFHYLGIPRAVMPEKNWFTTVPAWVKPAAQTPLPQVAGFTATDEASLAAGCDPDPDPENWAGYERFIPEAWLGTDLFTEKSKQPGVKSFAAAHEEAVLIDRTIDKPRSTSEQYLERWARLIETRLSAEPNLTPEVKRQVAKFKQAVNTGRVEARDEFFQIGRGRIGGFIARLASEGNGRRSLLLDGTRADLERAIASGESDEGDGGDEPPLTRSERREFAKIWTNLLRPAWNKAVTAGEVELPEEARAFEQHLLAVEETSGRQFMVYRDWQDPVLNEVFWRSGYAFPDKLNPAKAEAVARWAAERRAVIIEWGENAAEPAVRAAAKKLERFGVRAMVEPSDEATRPTSRRIAAERVLFYRRVLAAWAFLLATNDQPALAELRALIALESTPLP